MIEINIQNIGCGVEQILIPELLSFFVKKTILLLGVRIIIFQKFKPVKVLIAGLII